MCNNKIVLSFAKHDHWHVAWLIQYNIIYAHARKNILFSRMGASQYILISSGKCADILL